MTHIRMLNSETFKAAKRRIDQARREGRHEDVQAGRAGLLRDMKALLAMGYHRSPKRVG